MLSESDLRKAFTYFEPGPVILVTAHDKGQDNVMAISWQMVVDFTPEIALATGPWNHTFEMILASKECVLCVPGADLLDKVIGIGTVSGKAIDKFARFGLAKANQRRPSPASQRLPGLPGMPVGRLP